MLYFFDNYTNETQMVDDAKAKQLINAVNFIYTMHNYEEVKADICYELLSCGIIPLFKKYCGDQYGLKSDTTKVVRIVLNIYVQLFLYTEYLYQYN